LKKAVVLKVPRDLPGPDIKIVIMSNNKKDPFSNIRTNKGIDMVEIPKSPKDVFCDKCQRYIVAGLPYYKFIWQDELGRWKSHRSHKMCFDMHPEKDLH